MNQVPPFELKKIRSFNEVLNDTFAFLRIHFKKLFLPFALVMIPMAIISTLPTVNYNHQIMFRQNAYSGAFGSSTVSESPDLPSLILNGALMFLCYMLAFTGAITLVVCYIEAWMENPEFYPETKAIFKNFGSSFLKLLVVSIPLYILIVLGCLLCFAPGIWLSVLSCVFYPLYLFEGGSFQFSFRRSRELLSGSFWQTFGIVFVTYLIVAVIGGIFSYMEFVPALISTLKGEAAPGVSPLTIGLTFLATIARLFLQILPIIGMVIQYFNLKEQKEGTSLADKIENLGKMPDAPDFQRPNEEF